MATITPEATATDGGLTLADTDPEVEHFAPGSRSVRRDVQIHRS
jgi:hypothetical protein